MSFDLFLFRVDPKADFATASALLGDLMERRVVDSTLDARGAVDALLAIEPRYRRTSIDYAALAKLRDTSEEDLRREFDFISVDGPMDLRMAQVSFSPSYISLSCYSGTSEAELDRYLKELCRATGFSVVDPQGGHIYRLQPDGELAKT